MFFNRFLTAAAACVALGAPAMAAQITATAMDGSSITVTEAAGPSGSLFYNVANNTDSAMIAFGMTNSGINFPCLFDGDGFCNNLSDGTLPSATTSGGNTVSFGGFRVSAFDWDGPVAPPSSFLPDVSAAFEGLSFASLFGPASDTLGLDRLYWFYAKEGAGLAPGDSISNFFGVQSAIAESSLFAIISNDDGIQAFSSLSATAPSPIPLPAAGWLLLAGLGGLGLMARRRHG